MNASIFNDKCIAILQEIRNECDNDNQKKIIDNILQLNSIENLNKLTLDNIYDFTESVYTNDKTKEDSGTDNKFDAGYKDYRISRITFKNVRAFPYIKNRKPFGIDFINDKREPCSLYLIGSNGTGKSSITNILQHIYTGRISNKALKGIKNEAEYLTYGFERLNQTKSTDASIGFSLGKTHDIKESGLSNSIGVGIDAMFCSDYDVIELGKLKEENKEDIKYGLYEYAIGQLGFDSLYKLWSKLNSLIPKSESQNNEEQNLLTTEEFNTLIKCIIENYNELRSIISEELPDNPESISDRDPRKFSSENTIKKKIEEIYQSSSSEKEEGYIDIIKDNNLLFSEVWNQAYRNFAKIKEESDIDDTQLNNRINTLVNLYKNLCNIFENIKPDISLIDKLHNISVKIERSAADIQKKYTATDPVYSLTKSLAQKINDTLNKIFNELKSFEEFIKDCMKDFLESNERFEINFSNNNHNALITVNNNVQRLVGANGSTNNPDEVFRATPNEYFNTFRFKLFVVALKVSYTIFYMKQNRCYLPIIIDDVFNSNDFDNALQIHNFVEKIHKKYQEYINPGKKEDIKPLQLIMFTHDEKILSAFIKGTQRSIENKHTGSHRTLKDICNIGRLYNYRAIECQHQGEHKCASNCTRCTYDYRPFSNLYIKL